MKVSRGRCLLLPLIKAKGWNQAEYARRSGRSKRVISHFCNGRTTMTPEDMYVATKLLECRWEELYEFIEEGE
ncbi:helix-turn-helix transcriptional regulator [Paenibacillus sp. T2-29]